jgi:hypothetical protein
LIEEENLFKNCDVCKYQGSIITSLGTCDRCIQNRRGRRTITKFQCGILFFLNHPLLSYGVEGFLLVNL